MRAALATALLMVGLGNGLAYAQTAVTLQTQPTTAFAVDARFAFVDIDRVAAISAEGKAARGKLEALRAEKSADLETRSKQVEALQNKVNSGANVLDDAARASLQRDFQRAQLALRRASEDAQSDVEEARQEIMQAFSAKLFPIIGQIAKEKKIWAIFGNQSGVLWHDPVADLTEEVAKRLDAASAKK